MLRQGQTLTGFACPVCSTPLFRLKNGDLWCAKCEKEVVVVKEGEDAPKLTNAAMLDKIETILLAKIEKIQSKMQETEDTDELLKLSTTLSELLGSLEKIKRTKKI